MSGRPEKHAPRCPICQTAAAARYAPFCSRRCADLDLGRWLKGGYAIPGDPADEDAAAVPKPDQTSEDN